MTSEHFLSVCIPTMNRHHELKRTLNTLLSQSQTSMIQFVVSDNYSNDGTANFLNQLASEYPRLTYFRQKSRISFDQNVLAAVNRASGKYIWVLPDDDEIILGAIEKVLQRLTSLERNVGVFVNFGHSNNLNSSLDIERVVELRKDSFFISSNLDPSLIRSLSYIGSYISPAEDWKHVSEFIGSGFIHAGVALNSIARLGGGCNDCGSSSKGKRRFEHLGSR